MPLTNLKRIVTVKCRGCSADNYIEIGAYQYEANDFNALWEVDCTSCNTNQDCKVVKVSSVQGAQTK